MDRNYQRHKSFDEWQAEGKHFICRIKASTTREDHLISRSKYGLMVQMLAGLITYLLLAIFCYNEHQENVSVKRLREICIKIRNETSLADIVNGTGLWIYQPPGSGLSYAIT